MAGDCKSVQCDGTGQSQTVNDDTDKPVDGNACTQDLCNARHLVEPARGRRAPPAARATARSATAAAPRRPACSACSRADCPGTDTECHHRTCSAAGVCGISQHRGRDGGQRPDRRATARRTSAWRGAQVVVNDDTDVPVDDNGCTMDLCTAGMPSHPPLAINAPCNEDGGTRCNGSASAPACVACTAASQCGTDDATARPSRAAPPASASANPTATDGTAASIRPRATARRTCATAPARIVQRPTTPTCSSTATRARSTCAATAASQNPSLGRARACNQSNGSMCNGSATAPACVQCLQRRRLRHGHRLQDVHCATPACALDAHGRTVRRSSDAPRATATRTCAWAAPSPPSSTTTTCRSTATRAPTTSARPALPSNPNIDAGTICGPSLMCDGNGACVGCITDADCPAAAQPARCASA